MSLFDPAAHLLSGTALRFMEEDDQSKMVERLHNAIKMLREQESESKPDEASAEADVPLAFRHEFGQYRPRLPRPLTGQWTPNNLRKSEKPKPKPKLSKAPIFVLERRLQCLQSEQNGKNPPLSPAPPSSPRAPEARRPMSARRAQASPRAEEPMKSGQPTQRPRSAGRPKMRIVYSPRIPIKMYTEHHSTALKKVRVAGAAPAAVPREEIKWELGPPTGPPRDGP